MSGIWGRIQQTIKPVPAVTKSRMKNAYMHCEFDKIVEITEQNDYFACGHQYITLEDKQAILPFYDAETKVFYTADVYLYDRKKLMEQINIHYPGVNIPLNLSDANLLYLAIQHFGMDALSWIYGSFSFVYYDKKQEIIYAATDQTGSRVLYYQQQEYVFSFSTLIAALLKEDTILINEEWVTDFLSMDHFILCKNGKDTPYKHIYKIEPGTYIRVTKEEIKTITYWNPLSSTLKNHTWSLSLDNDYKHKFIHTYQNAVLSCLRSSEETGILLSGGLDSCSVAAFAAPLLKVKKKTLFSFTSVPKEGYEATLANTGIVNEKKIVEKTIDKIGNISPLFLDCGSKDSWSSIKELQNIFEIPFKSLQNLVWMKECVENAKEKGCKIMLTGQYGNATVSSGDPQVNLYTYFKKKKWKSLILEIRNMNKIYGYSRKMIFSFLIKSVWYKKKCEEFTLLDALYINTTTRAQYQSLETLKEINGVNRNKYLEYKDTLADMFDQKALSQIGEFETKLSLYTGVRYLDPTRHPDIITLCLSMPMECFVKNGLTRRLIRGYMKDYLLPFHSNNLNFYGEQSADTCERLRKNWENTQKELEQLFDLELAAFWIDQKKIKEDLNYSFEKLDTDSFFVTKLLYHGGLLQFLSSVAFIKQEETTQEETMQEKTMQEKF